MNARHTAARPLRSWRLAVVLTCGTALTACPPSSTSPTAAPAAAPTHLAYSTNPAVYTKGAAITDNTPSSAGGAVASYEIQPPLPPGLTLNAATGVISGTPTVARAQTTFTVTATNAGGSTAVALVITVNDVAPTAVTYAPNPAVFTKGIGNAITPSHTGGAPASYTVSPPLPAGLTLNASTGVIGGTPAAVTPQATYTVTASNGSGSVTVAVVIAVNDVGPRNLTYSDVNPTYTRGVAITPNTPANEGGAIVSYSVSPALPEGLTLNAATGVISGTPTGAPSLFGHSCYVTGTNSGGSTFVHLVVVVVDAPPAMLRYSRAMPQYAKGFTIAANAPSNAGGAIVSYSVSPPLPAGLTLDRDTGVISGTPTALAATEVFTVTGTNTGGSTDAVVVIGVTLAEWTLGGGHGHSCALSDEPWCWGKNDRGQLGNDSLTNSLVPVRTKLGYGQVIAAGYSHTCSIDSLDLGQVFCWGANGYGQLGDGTTVDSDAAAWTHKAGMKAIAVGGYHTCSLRADGEVLCWGANNAGQLGDGTASEEHDGTVVSGTAPGQTYEGVQAITAGLYHTCAIRNAGALCWGANADGQAGDGTTSPRNTPVSVYGLSSGVQAIAAGGFHSCAVVSGGARCWGYNVSGQLGNQSTASSTRPVFVAGLSTGVQAITAGFVHTCALVNGGVWCWGSNGFGQLGNRSVVDSHQPVQVDGLSSGVQAIAAGAYHTCARANGRIHCWGANGTGQLGDDSTLTATSPVQVVGFSY